MTRKPAKRFKINLKKDRIKNKPFVSAAIASITIRQMINCTVQSAVEAIEEKAEKVRFQSLLYFLTKAN